MGNSIKTVYHVYYCSECCNFYITKNSDIPKECNHINDILTNWPLIDESYIIITGQKDRCIEDGITSLMNPKYIRHKVI